MIEFSLILLGCSTLRWLLDEFVDPWLWSRLYFPEPQPAERSSEA